MIQVFLYDDNGFYIHDEIVSQLGSNMTTVPITTGYVKPFFNGEEWEEGATSEEIAAWQAQQIDICSTPTTEERLADLENVIISLLS